jgi:integral membrane protein (TIGR01906 family)
MTSSNNSLLSWLTALLTAIAIILTSVRLLLTPAYAWVEYHTPGFPEDPYGFTLEERLTWSRPAIEYLLNDAGIEYLADLKFADGTPLYNERELSHMVDVKNVVAIALRVWLGALIGLALLGVWAWRGGWLAGFRDGVGRGGWLTLGLIGAVIVFVLVGFGVIFVLFHEVFFAPGTWTFLYSDTLIRLFPERFWRDTFLWFGALAGLLALGALALGRGRR